MSTPRPFIVYARERGRVRVVAYNRRHAVVAAAIRLGLTESETREVTSWAVSEQQTNQNIFDGAKTTAGQQTTTNNPTATERTAQNAN